MAEKEILLETFLDVFRFNRKDSPNLSGRILQRDIPTDPGEAVFDFGVDYLNANISYLRNTSLTSNRYNDYNLMNAYPLINDSLDIIAAEATQSDEDGTTVFLKTYDEDEIEEEVAERESEMLNKYLKQFVRSVTGNHLFTYFRQYLLNGDLLFVPIYNKEKSKILKYVSVPVENVKIVVDTETYQIVRYIVTPPGEEQQIVDTFNQFIKAEEYPPEHVMHFSLDPEGSKYFPYGSSVLDPIALVYKQLRLLEDSLLVYRITRAPERRVFYVDVGELPPAKAEKYLLDIRNKFIRKNFFDPTTGEVNNEYNPLTHQEDIYIPRRPGGAETEVTTLPGAQNLGELGDVTYFKNQVVQGLKVPHSFLRDDGGAVFADGRVGTAYIAEIRFANYVETLQRGFIEQFEAYFRKYLKKIGVKPNIKFSLEMHPPSSYKEYKQNELELSRIANYSQLAGNEEMSTEFLQEKYLGWSYEDIQENKELKAAENELEAEMEEEMGGAEENMEFDTGEEEPPGDEEPPAEA